MSRLGKVPVGLPDGVKVAVKGDVIEVEGKKGKLTVGTQPGLTVTVDEQGVLVSRADDSRDQRAKQGLVRSLVTNAVRGVSEGWTRTLEMTGVGYRADVKKQEVHLQLGYSHPIVYTLPEGVSAKVDNQNTITIEGIDLQVVGEVAAGIRKLRPPEPYKGKGIRYSDEQIRRKAGKAGAAAG